jgi:hypothetical protein
MLRQVGIARKGIVGEPLGKSPFNLFKNGAIAFESVFTVNERSMRLRHQPPLNLGKQCISSVLCHSTRACRLHREKIGEHADIRITN